MDVVVTEPCKLSASTATGKNSCDRCGKPSRLISGVIIVACIEGSPSEINAWHRYMMPPLLHTYEHHWMAFKTNFLLRQQR